MSNGIKIAVIEDNLVLQELLVECITQRGFEVKGLSCGEELNEHLLTNQMDLLVLDLKLPGEDGLSIAKRLRAINPSLYILMLTASASEKDKVRGYENGADIYMLKPASPLEVSSAIANIEKRICNQRNLAFISRHDGLTGCLNKKTLIELLESQMLYTKRYKNKLSIIMMDLDNFKKINDQHGHLEGDKVLINFANQAKTCLRDSDHLARFGGDEFIAILPNIGLPQAKLVANRIVELGSASRLALPWSVSTGVAEWGDSDDSFEDLIERADKALYQSKLASNLL